MMKLEAIIQTYKLDAVKDSLQEAGIEGISRSCCVDYLHIGRLRGPRMLALSHSCAVAAKLDDGGAPAELLR